MNQFKVVSGDNFSEYYKTEADAEQFQRALDFVRSASNYNNEMILPALRALGYKSTVVKLDAQETFEF